VDTEKLQEYQIKIIL